MVAIYLRLTAKIYTLRRRNYFFARSVSLRTGLRQSGKKLFSSFYGPTEVGP